MIESYSNLIPEVRKIFLFLFIILGSSTLYACDPILESLIFSRDQITKLDLSFRHFSTLLNELGSAYRQKTSYNQKTVSGLRSTWLQIYQSSYLKPPSPGPSIQDWQAGLDRVAEQLKVLWKSKGEELHRIILSIQSELVNLYRGVGTDFQSRKKFLLHLAQLWDKSGQADEAIRNRLESPMVREWIALQSDHGSSKIKGQAGNTSQSLNEKKTRKDSQAGKLLLLIDRAGKGESLHELVSLELNSRKQD